MMFLQFSNGCGNIVSWKRIILLLSSVTNRLNSRELLIRKNVELPDYNCVLCRHNVEESLMHLFFECPFSKWRWRFVKVQWNTSLHPEDMLIRSRCQFRTKIFKEVLMVAD
jgi:hypothetical protein